MFSRTSPAFPTVDFTTMSTSTIAPTAQLVIHEPSRIDAPEYLNCYPSLTPFDTPQSQSLDASISESDSISMSGTSRDLGYVHQIRNDILQTTKSLRERIDILNYSPVPPFIKYVEEVYRSVPENRKADIEKDIFEVLTKYR